MRAKPVERPPPLILSRSRKQITESDLEAEEDHSLIVSNVVLLAKKILNIFLGNRSTLRVNNFNGLPINSKENQVYHLTTLEKRVSHELSNTNSNGSLRHD